LSYLLKYKIGRETKELRDLGHNLAKVEVEVEVEVEVASSSLISRCSF